MGRWFWGRFVVTLILFAVCPLAAKKWGPETFFFFIQGILFHAMFDSLIEFFVWRGRNRDC